MPAKADARCKVIFSVGKSLAVITETNVKREIAVQVNVVLHEDCIEPLRQLVTADAVIHRLRISLNVSKRQLIEWLGAVNKTKRTEDGSAGFAAGAAGSVMND